ncbi:hypothetical protein Ddc_03037 [Ditylenchus destructor]|nr:hypothetical protein Ddc_03037 [Ditylenchus destructor]
MGRSRSPRKGDRRDRSRERKRDHSSRDRESRERSSRSSRERDRDDRDRRHRSKDKKDRQKDSHKSEKIQKEIEAAKNRLRTSLNSAISSLKEEPAQGTSDEKKDFTTTLSVMDSLSHQARIRDIEEEGFRPSSFHSSNANRNTLTGLMSGKNNGNDGDTSLKEHDKAMFGPMWASREIERKHATKDTKSENDNSATPIADIKLPAGVQPIMGVAHERLAGDPIERQRKWMELFKEQRRLLMEGAL